jgi:hypothetical protein
MDSIQTIEQTFRYLEPAALLLVILRLAGQGLAARYKAFAAYLTIWLCQDLVPLVFGWGLGSNEYARFFFASEPWAWLFSCLVLIELFDLTFTRFPGIRSAGKLLLTAAIVAGIFVGIGTAVPTLFYRRDAGGLLLLFSVLERSVMLVVLVLLGALQFLLVHYRLQLPRNTVVYGFTYAVYFTARALQALVMSELGPGYSIAANAATMAVDLACLLVWAFALTRTGVTDEIVTGRKLSDEERARLRNRLVALNEALGRLGHPK